MQPNLGKETTVVSRCVNLVSNVVMDVQVQRTFVEFGCECQNAWRRTVMSSPSFQPPADGYINSEIKTQTIRNVKGGEREIIKMMLSELR